MKRKYEWRGNALWAESVKGGPMVETRYSIKCEQRMPPYCLLRNGAQVSGGFYFYPANARAAAEYLHWLDTGMAYQEASK